MKWGRYIRPGLTDRMLPIVRGECPRSCPLLKPSRSLETRGCSSAITTCSVTGTFDGSLSREAARDSNFQLVEGDHGNANQRPPAGITKSQKSVARRHREENGTASMLCFPGRERTYRACDGNPGEDGTSIGNSDVSAFLRRGRTPKGTNRISAPGREFVGRNWEASPVRAETYQLFEQGIGR